MTKLMSSSCWKENKLARLSDLFEIRYGTNLELNRLVITENGEGIPFVGRSKENNGVTAWVELLENVEPIPKGMLSVALGGSVLETFYQNRPFYSGRDVGYLIPKKNLSPVVLQYYACCIRANKFRYNYARQANRTIKDLIIPSVGELPNWLIKIATGKIEAQVEALISGRSSAPIDTAKWGVFELQTLFDIKKGERLTKKDMTSGDTPFIGATDSNNGVTAYIGQKPIHEGNTISVNYNGSVGEAFYQPVPFWASDDVNVLYPKFEMTPELGIFLVTIIRHEGKTKFSYVRKWKIDRMATTTIKLPTNKTGNPDWKTISKISNLAYKKTGL